MTMAQHAATKPMGTGPGAGTCSRRTLLTGAVAAGAASAFTRPGSARAAGSQRLIVRGMSLPSWWNGTYRSPRYRESLAALQERGFNAVAIVPTHVIETASGSRILDSEQSESFDEVAQAVDLARRHGVQVLLRPQLGVVDHAVTPQALDPADKPAFFEDYRALITRYARLAERTGVSFLAVGGELARLTRAELRDPWLQVIDCARQAFSGPLLYAAASGEDLQVSFWDALDYIGVEMCAWTPPDSCATTEAIVHRWTHAPAAADTGGAYGRAASVDMLRRLSRDRRKPVLLTGVGVRSTTGAFATPFDCGQASVAADFVLQSSLYRSLMQIAVAEQDGWLAGMFLSGWRIDALPQEPVWA
jgi:hypothetical protein